MFGWMSSTYHQIPSLAYQRDILPQPITTRFRHSLVWHYFQTCLHQHAPQSEKCTLSRRRPSRGDEDPRH
ncbi:hypothetical protein C8Q74DRAFT_28872 [Fomes fomentarius]|nr:hypothetical protein C8Q74DRAFT_28872 [Fomes fomentarius]